MYSPVYFCMLWHFCGLGIKLSSAWGAECFHAAAVWRRDRTGPDRIWSRDAARLICWTITCESHLKLPIESSDYTVMCLNVNQLNNIDPQKRAAARQRLSELLTEKEKNIQITASLSRNGPNELTNSSTWTTRTKSNMDSF